MTRSCFSSQTGTVSEATFWPVAWLLYASDKCFFVIGCIPAGTVSRSNSPSPWTKVLRSLAEDAGKRIQVTYATHSPYFLEARHFDQVRRLTRSSDETPVVTVHFATVTDVKAKLNGVLDADKVGNQLDAFVANELSVALFAHRVLLVEGTTESSVFYGIGDKTTLGSLEAAGVSIVPVGGKTSIPLAHAILKAIGIPVYALFDADGGFEARAKAKGKPQKKIIRAK